MSESQATTSVRGDCASPRRTAASVAAAPPVVTRNSRRVNVCRIRPSSVDSSRGDGLEAVENVTGVQYGIALHLDVVDGDEPLLLVGAEIPQHRHNRRALGEVTRATIGALRHEAPQVAVHMNGDRHARTRGMTSVWKRSITVSMRPSAAIG